MMPACKNDFEAKDKISKLLSHKKLMGKYGPKYGKYLEGYVKGDIWQLDRSALELMAEKYGDVTVAEAVEKFSAEKPWRNND